MSLCQRVAFSLSCESRRDPTLTDEGSVDSRRSRRSLSAPSVELRRSSHEESVAVILANSRSALAGRVFAAEEREIMISSRRLRSEERVRAAKESNSLRQ